MAKFKKGQIANPKGCPKGAHHIGRPKDAIVQETLGLATEAAPLIMSRFIRVSLGEKLEQVVTEAGECIPVPAPVPAQIKAGEVVLTYVIQKAAERVEVTGADGDPLNGIPTSQVVELIAAIRQRNSATGGKES